MKQEDKIFLAELAKELNTQDNAEYVQRLTNTVKGIFVPKKRNRNLLNNSGLWFSFFSNSGFWPKNAVKHARKLRFLARKG